MTTSLIERVKTEGFIKPLPSSFEELKSQKERVLKHINGRLPCEREYINSIKLSKLDPWLESAYPHISLDFLKWRNDDVLPSFAIFNAFGSGICDFKLIYNGRENLKYRFINTLDYPNILFEKNKNYNHIKPYFQDIYEKLFSQIGWFRRFMNRRDRSNSEVSISQTFAGAIPDKTRVVINSVSKFFNKNDIFIITEAAQWNKQIRTIPEIVNPDPLVVGLLNGESYLLDTFDLTDLEKLVAGEFSA